MRFGRGAENEVPLADIRVELQAAALYQRGGGLFIEKVGDSPLRVNGQTVETASVRPGDEFVIGPYRIELTEPPADTDAALSIELVQPLGDMLERLVSQSRIGLEKTGLNKRRLSWGLFLLLIVLCLGIPVGAYSVGGIATLKTPVAPPGPLTVAALSWNAGELSNTHRFFAQQCATCHRGAFASVPDSTCLSCHAGVGAHVERVAAVHFGGLAHEAEAMRCTQCHIEHRGLDALVIRQQGLCVQCHRSLAEKAPQAKVRDVTGFPAGHPQFRATLVADAAQHRLVRVYLDGTPKPLDHPDIKFSHAAHLVKKGWPALHLKALKCADCHVPDAGGKGFLPITYKNQCERCHALTFDKLQLPWPKAKVPHGDDSRIVAAVWNFYAGKALQGAMRQSQSHDAGLLRRAAGAPPAAMAQPPQSAQAWVARNTEAALRGVIFEKKRGCAYCHYGTGPDGAFKVSDIIPRPLTAASAAAVPAVRIVAPVMMRTRFLPPAEFNHAKHAPIPCADCHAAQQSKSSMDVLIPGKERCAACHGHEKSALKTQTTCITCHVFHREALGPMRPPATLAEQ